MIKKYPSVILGMFETGLAVGRSLGRNGIKVFGFDYKKDVGFYSKYIKAEICPNPMSDEKNFIDYLINFGEKLQFKPVLFITSDNFINSISRNRNKLNKFYFINLPDHNIIESITDKNKQYQLALKANIPLPTTYLPNDLEEIERIKHKIKYPAYMKPKDVTSWRKAISHSIKGFVLNNPQELIEKYKYVLEKGLEVIIQEIIPGPDSNLFKYNSYVSQNKEFLLQFTLRKVFQNPIHFGIGVTVKSIKYPELMTIGKRFIENINYNGISSVEFKLDSRDGKLKLIELNPRYWQQNSLADICGMNFPLMNYLDVTQQNPKPIDNFREDIIWINTYNSFGSFLNYRRIGEIHFYDWIDRLRGEKNFAVYSLDDILPFCIDLINKSFSVFKNLK
jgi:predicted ATP-grasp superfamily ATP-dependent carboligase